jgi:hypothetical protein
VRHMEVGADRPAHPVHLCQGVPETQMLLVGLVHAVGEQARDGARENSESTSVTDELENAMPACACFVSASASLAGRSVIMHTNGSRTVTDVTWQRHTCGCCIQSRVPLPTMLRGARQSCADTIASCLQVPREPLQIVMRTWYAASHTPASTLTSSLPERWCCSHLRTPVCENKPTNSFCMPKPVAAAEPHGPCVSDAWIN